MEETLSETEAAILQCPRCRSQLNVGEEIEHLDESCPVCKSEMKLFVFPRLFRAPTSSTAGKLSVDGDATCTFYPELKAEKVCDACGCFMSEKAAVRWSGGDYCLPCIHRLREEERSAGFLAKTKRYDYRALALVWLLAPFSLFTAPVAIYLLLRYRKSNVTFVPGGKAVWWVAMISSILMLLGWAFLIVIWVSLIVDGLS